MLVTRRSRSLLSGTVGLGRLHRLLAATLALVFVALPAAPAVAAVCPTSSPCPLMARVAETGLPCGGEVAGGSMDCCAGRQSGEPVQTEAAVAPEAPVAIQIPAAAAVAAALPALAFAVPARLEAATGPTLFLLHAVFRL